MHLFIPIFSEVNSMRDLWELWSFKATVATALLTLIGGVVTAALGVWQSRKDYRWKQAKLARTLLDGIFDYDPSNDAWRMVDGEELYKDKQKNEYQITMDDVRKALPQPWNEDKGGKDVYIRWCFDALFYDLERLESSVQLNLLRMDDLMAPVSYYIALMSKDKKVFLDYAKLIRFNGAVAFMNRFPEWRNNES